MVDWTRKKESVKILMMVGRKPPRLPSGITLVPGAKAGDISEKPQVVAKPNVSGPKLPSVPSSPSKGEKEKIKTKPRDVEAEIAQVRAKKKQIEEQKEEEKRILEELRRRQEKERKAALIDAQALLHPSPKKKKNLPPWAQRGTKEKGLRRSV